MNKEWSELEWKEKICQDVYKSLCRLCGGGGDGLNDPNDEENKSKQRLLLWQKELKELAYKSISFPNGGRIHHHDCDNTQKKKKSGGGNKPHNIEIRAALTYFHRYRPKTRGKKRSLEIYDEEIGSEKGDQSLILEIVSDLGLVRNIDSAVILANLLVLDIEQQQQQQQQNNHNVNGVYDVRACPKSGIICGTTRQRSHYLRTVMKKLPCPYCITWAKDLKGLWWHQQLQHGINHSQAVSSATMEKDNINSSHSLVIYKQPSQRSIEATTLTSNTDDANAKTENETSGLNQVKNSLEQNKTAYPELILEKNNTFDRFNGKKELEREDNDPVSFVKNYNFSKLMEYGATAEGKMNIVNYLDKNGASCLHWAAGLGHLDIVKYIVEKYGGTNDDIVNQKQKGKRSFRFRTPLHWAARNGHFSVVRYLCSQTNIQIDATTVDGTTAFCWASWQGHSQIMQFLYSIGGCNPHLQNEFGCNAVLWAAQGENEVDIIQWLSSIHCDIYQINSNGHGVLHKAAQRGHFYTCKWLLHDIILSSSKREWDKNNDENIAKYIRVISPDVENYCPSDLAGMEGNEVLAAWLSQHECELAYKFFKKSIRFNSIKCATYTKVARWLYDEIIEIEKNVSCVYANNLDVWESGGGKRRMASYIVRKTMEN